jgi:hypothetical protein
VPLKKYDKEFGGKGGAAKAHAAMIKQYGEKKGEEVFYATKNRNKKRGKNPFFGNALPFQLGDGGRWFDDSRPMGKMMTKKKG